MTLDSTPGAAKTSRSPSGYGENRNKRLNTNAVENLNKCFYSLNEHCFLNAFEKLCKYLADFILSFIS